MQKFKDVPGTQRYPVQVPALVALAGAGAGAGVKNIGFLRQVPAPATGTRVSSDISILDQQRRPIACHSRPAASKKSVWSAVTSPTPSKPDQDNMLPGISPPGSTGVIFVMDRAMANGFSYDDHTWPNFGQGLLAFPFRCCLHIDKLKANINQMGLSALFSSNLRTPTGQAVEGAELEELIQVSRNGQGVILDEFYKRYNLNGQLGESLSAAKYYKGPLLSLSTYQVPVLL
ncbi:uncharacterized protein PGTG_20336 [Puccinia graminis f. sp. tritici CRL 75-36-700-3]|uniref:Aminotransferase class I/classII domain-containing protein n=1 Tax=Puccinia graminis f. sp. tritici (strain CRL 75-36-700-3 / race SCCL) TaxID=418459 RepID=E3NXT1_PUCGT|nr:uncharacterized protein PGTG_20336 [Puccinia graminis f. sp. tritici CRL 75-36-700-3]EFP94380.2 hypothetical protein PGTG_20336 [Puccinia graminis f. sp. tritici CRL 75-36-700-3]